MNITVIFTGGTIGSKDRAGIISVDAADQYRLLDLYRSSGLCETEVSFKTVEPYTILSEMLNGKHIEKLVRCVGNALSDPDCDGVIVTHGSDTLQYSAAVLECIFGMSNKPVVLVASNYVLDDKRANGLDNFTGAVRLIQDQKYKGVFLSYKNPGEDVSYLRGDRLLLPQTYSDKMYVYEMADERAPFVYDIKFEDFRLTEKSNEILVIKVYPGMMLQNVEGLCSKSGTKVIIIEGYHSGTMSVDKELAELAGNLNKLGVYVFLVGLSGANSHYETVEEYKNLSIIPLLDELPVTVYCKAWIALSNGLDIGDVFQI